MAPSHKHPFYGYKIIPRDQQEYINKILQKYKNTPFSEELKKTIWDELQREKHLGHITIPFKMITINDPTGKFPSRFEIILDTKV